MYKVLFVLAGLALPLLLWPIEIVVPYPHIIEELAKWAVVTMLAFPVTATSPIGWKWVCLFGITFASSETVLYLVNYWLLGSVSSLPVRIFFTTVLHVGTISIFYATHRSAAWKQWGGVTAAILLHYLYNAQIAPFFE